MYYLSNCNCIFHSNVLQIKFKHTSMLQWKGKNRNISATFRILFYCYLKWAIKTFISEQTFSFRLLWLINSAFSIVRIGWFQGILIKLILAAPIKCTLWIILFNLCGYYSKQMLQNATVWIFPSHNDLKLMFLHRLT